MKAKWYLDVTCLPPDVQSGLAIMSATHTVHDVTVLGEHRRVIKTKTKSEAQMLKERAIALTGRFLGFIGSYYRFLNTFEGGTK